MSHVADPSLMGYVASITLLPLIAPHEHARLLRYRDDRLAGKAVPTHYEYQGMRQDGSFVWLDMQVRLVTWTGSYLCLIITDLLMPGQDGLETIEVLRQDDPVIKILAMSGGTRLRNMDFLPVAQHLGAHRTLYKPFSRDEFLTTIREMVQE